MPEANILETMPRAELIVGLQRSSHNNINNIVIASIILIKYI